MPLSIRAKLFLTLLVAVVLAVIATQAFVHWSFLRNLQELAEARQQEHIDQIAERLVTGYARDRSWLPLKQDKRLWLQALFAGRGWHDHQRGEHRTPRRLPPWLQRALLKEDQWPPRAAAVGNPSVGNTRPGRSDTPTGPLHRLGAGPPPLPFRLMLLDADGTIIYGRRELLPKASLYPLELDGRRIGTLALLPGPALSDAAQRRFRDRQGNEIWIIALGTVALAALLAMPAAALLTRPVRALQQTARRLARGDYEARAPTPTRDELGRLAEDLNALATTLSRNEGARRRWVSDIAHELRTPLSLLRADIEAMQDDVRPIDTAALAALHEAVLRIGRLVEDLNELTLTEPGTLAYQRRPIDVAELVADSVSDERARFAEQGLDLGIERVGSGPWMLDADPDRLTQLMQNLLENSRAYTDPGQPVRVRLERRTEQLLIMIDDGPPGVSDAALPHLFERLYRADGSRNRRTGGAGLGLAIARNIVEAHGGTIDARQSSLGGLGIRISLPVSIQDRPRETTDR